MNKSIKLGGVFAVVIATAFTLSSAMAYQDDYSKQGPAYSPERHTAMTKAMENNDYAAWSELMADRGRVTKVINAENFGLFAEAHRLSEVGDVAGTDAIRGELGLRTSNGEKIGAGYGERQNAMGDKQGHGKRGQHVNL